jgi:tetratricopeptide (TPR) repeat protein
VVALVAGEPGIGKTRLVTEAVARTGCQVVWASCWEGDGAPAYWPWMQLMRGLRPIDERVSSRADEFPELATVLSRSADGGATDTRFALFDAVTDAFAAAAVTRPVVLVIDDLQWADASSIRLLRFLARDPRTRRLAIIAAYRDSAVTADRPLADALGELASRGLHIHLEGLDEHSVAVLAQALVADGTVVPSARLVRRRSGGNPLFVRELARLLDAGTGSGARDVQIPSSVRAVVAARLGGLSAPARGALAAAAVIGSEFDVRVLGPMTARSNASVLNAVDEARSVRLVDAVEGSRFAFAHALVQEVLYDSLSLSERTELHGRAADVIEQQHGDVRISEIAHHRIRSAVGEPDERAVDWAMRAAEHSVDVLAYEQAVAWYGSALGLLPSDRPELEGELLIQRGNAAIAAGDLPSAREAFRQAAVVARSHGDVDRLARAALGLGAGHGGFEVPLNDHVQISLLEETLATLGPDPSALRARLLARLSVALSFAEGEVRRRGLSEEAIATARAVGDDSALGYALAVHCDVIAGPEWSEERRDEAAEVVRLARLLGDRELELLGRRLRLVALLELGDMPSADEEVSRFERVADSLRQPLYRWYVPLWHGMRALMRGDLAEAIRLNAEAEHAGRLAHSQNAVLLTLTQRWVCQRAAGEFVESGEELAALLGLQPGGTPLLAGDSLVRMRAVIAAQLGDVDRVATLIDQLVRTGVHERAHDSEWLPEMCQLAEVVALVGDGEIAELLLEQLAPYSHRFCVEGIGAAFSGSVSWYLAMLARSLGRTADARAYDIAARDAHQRVGLVGDPPPLAPAHATRRTASPQDRSAAMIHEGATWAVSYAGTTVRLRDSKGLRDLAVLLARPDQEIHCLELVGGVHVAGDAGPALDQKARLAYEQRIRDLHLEIDDARRTNDPFRAERAETELDALVEQLSAAFGLGGRARATGATAERARSTVTARIRATIRQAGTVHPELGRHLQNAVRTGTWCGYRPEAAVSWDISSQLTT